MFVLVTHGGVTMPAGWRSRAFITLGGSRALRPVALAMAAVMVLSGMETLTPSAAEAAPVTAPAKPACPDDRPDATSASLTARLCGKKVEVTGARTEKSLLWALPEGGFSSQVHNGPV